MFSGIAHHARAERPSVANVDEAERDILRKRRHHLTVAFDHWRDGKRVLHEQTGTQDRPFQSAFHQVSLDRVMAAEHGRFRVSLHYRLAAGDFHEVADTRRLCGFYDADLLFGHLRTVAGDHENAVATFERLFQRG